MATKCEVTISKPRKMKTISMLKEPSVIEDHEQGLSRDELMVQYALKKSKLYDIKEKNQR